MTDLQPEVDASDAAGAPDPSVADTAGAPAPAHS